MSDDYTNRPTRIRVFFEGPGWSIDGADDDGKYTEVVMDHDYRTGERMTRAVAVELAPLFAADHGWDDLPVIVVPEH